jgi:ketosteroid isomerase-like protein
MEVKNEQDYEAWKAQTDETAAVVQGAIDALNSGDTEGFVGAFSPDFEFWMPGTTPVSGRTKGLEEFGALVGQVADYLDVQISIKVTNFIACGEWVVSEAVGHGVTKKGENYDNSYCHLWKVENGKIVKFVEYNDTDLILRVLCA